MRALRYISKAGEYDDMSIAGWNRNEDVGLHVHVPRGQHIHVENINIKNVFIPVIKTGYGLFTFGTLTTQDFGGDNMNIRGNGNVKGNILNIISNTPTRPYGLCIRQGTENIRECLLRHGEVVHDPDLLTFQIYKGKQCIIGYHVDGVFQAYATPEKGYPAYTDGSGIVSNIDIAHIYADLTGPKTQAIIGSERCVYDNIHLGYEAFQIKLDGYPYHTVFNTLSNSTIGCIINSVTPGTKIKVKDVKSSGHKIINNKYHGFKPSDIITEDKVMNIPVEMKLSEEGLNALLHEEGFRTQVYKDSKGLPTIGVGHLLTPEELSRQSIRLHTGERISTDVVWTKTQVMQLLRDDLYRFRKAVNRLAPQLNQGQFDALMSFAFNIGVGGFLKSTAYRRVKAGNHDRVPDAMMMWRKPPEIIGRRRREAAMYYNATNKIPTFKPSDPEARVMIDDLTIDELNTALEILG